MPQSNYCVDIPNRVGVGGVLVGTPPRATARVPAPLLSTPALTMTTIEASPVAYHCKGGSGEEQGGDPCGRPGGALNGDGQSCRGGGGGEWGGGPFGRPRGGCHAAKRHHGVRAPPLALLFALTLLLVPRPTTPTAPQ